MSWGILIHGKPGDALNAAVNTALDNALKNYSGTPEGDDIESARRTILSATGAFKDGSYANGYAIDAGGSRGNGANLKVTITPIRIVD